MEVSALGKECTKVVHNRTASLWSFAGTLTLIAVLAYAGNGFALALKDLALFCTGRINDIHVNGVDVLEAIPVVFAVLVIDLPLSILAGMISVWWLGKPKGSHALGSAFPNSWHWRGLRQYLHQLHNCSRGLFWTAVDNAVGNRGKKDEGSLFQSFFVLCFLEEFLARLVCLGGYRYLDMDSRLFFYAMFFIGNGVWAWIHVKNYQDPQDQHWFRTFPQWVSGVFYSYIFVKYGMLAGLLTHFGGNAVLFSLHKVQRTDYKDAILTGTAAIYAWFSYSQMDKPLSDLLLWSEENATFQLPGWTFWDYILAAVFVPAFLRVVFGLLMYDRNDLKTAKWDSFSKLDFVTTVGVVLYAGVAIVVVIALTIGMLYGMFWVMGFAVQSVPHRITVLAVFGAFKHKGSSGSAVARTFWTALPGLYVTLCTMQALGYQQSLMAMPLLSLIGLPILVLQAIDD